MSRADGIAGIQAARAAHPSKTQTLSFGGDDADHVLELRIVQKNPGNSGITTTGFDIGEVLLKCQLYNPRRMPADLKIGLHGDFTYLGRGGQAEILPFFDHHHEDVQNALGEIIYLKWTPLS